MPSAPESIEHAAFSRAAAEGLAAGDARPIVGPAWVDGWDAVLLQEVPGAVEVYAIGAAGNPEEMQGRIDRLADGLVSALPAVPLHLIVVLAAGDAARRLTRLGPRTYHQTLRPQTWVADLATGTVHAPRLGRADGFAAIQAAVRGQTAPPTRAPGQMQDFRLLMRERQPLLTYGLIALNIVIFLLLYTRGGPGSTGALVAFGAIQPRLILAGQWWRLITGIFLHASIPHILFNMTSLFAVGTLAERLYGSGKFLAIYLGAGLIGSLVSLEYAILTGTLDVVGVGASGAIFGVAGALITVRFHASDVIPQRLRDRVSVSMVPLVLISLALAYLTPYVDNAAHIGGLLGGMALSFAFPLTRRRPETARWWS